MSHSMRKLRTHTVTHGTTYGLPRWTHTNKRSNNLQFLMVETKSYNALLFCFIDINGTGSVELASYMIVKSALLLVVKNF